MLSAKTDAKAFLPMAKSATGVTEVITGGVTLFVGFGSSVGEVTLAVLVKVPATGAVTIRVKFVVTLAAKVANDQLTTPLLAEPPPFVLTKVTPAGKASVTTTLLAVEGPKFVTEMV